MKFGQVPNPGDINFSLPPDHPATAVVLERNDQSKPLNVYVGCAKWNKTDLKGFYPRGTKDELSYYSTQFNSIELNATFYGMPPADRVITWRDKTSNDFRFFPKITQSISHMRRLNNVEKLTEEYCDNISNFEQKLGMAFLQLHDNFGYKNYDRLVNYLENFPKAIPLAVELRNTSWFNEDLLSDEVYHLFEQSNMTNIIVDTAGRRDLLHMRLTTPVAFIRYVGANDHQSDRDRLNEWVDRLKSWVDQGLRDIYFFVHQNMEKESPLLSAHFIENLNKELGTNLKIPKMA
ncbi:DUF72 domain-containing protein [Mangrovibacterium lignilyticum]|uniref:DUF72 domain-containing protein n=1 Tax=Mangrovibacterium lignilyticum TaxID=2668052 RepID=UPI0013D7E4EE|nr:DUF72 domain-containing protein [Mangrovibacterium lignilyticum]